MTKYKNVTELKNALSYFKSYEIISYGEKKVYDCLISLSDDYTWAIYLAVSDLVDSFMRLG